jgi:hypothetical protein
MKVILCGRTSPQIMKVVDIDFQNTVVPYFHRMPLKRKTKHMALDGILSQPSVGTNIVFCKSTEDKTILPNISSLFCQLQGVF